MQGRPWRHRVHLRIRHLLVGLALLGLLPMALFAAFLLNRQWHAHQEQVRRELGTITLAVRAHVDQEMLSNARQLERVAKAPSLRAASLDDFRIYMQRLVQERGAWAQLVLARPDGSAALDSDGDPSTAALPADLLASTREEWWTSGLAFDRRGNPAVVVAIRLDGARLGGWVLAARLAPDYLESLARSGVDDAARTISVVDQAGRIVSRNREFRRYFGTPGTPSYLKLIESAPKGSALSRSVEGRAMAVAWQRADNGWTVGVGLDPDRLESPLRLSTGLLAAGAGLLLLTVTAALLLARRIAGQVRAAAADAQELARGRVPQRRRSGNREIDSLFRSLHRAGIQLARTEQERNRAMCEAQDELKRRDHFLSVLAHELRNPLAPVTQAVWLLHRSPGLASREQRWIGVIEKQARQLKRLVDDLLETSRLTHNKVRLQPQRFSLRELVLDALEAAQPGFAAAGVQLAWVLPNGPVPWEGDPQRIAQVLQNLLSNAGKFVPAGGHVVLKLEVRGERIRIAVSDDGPGLQPGYLEEIFQPFSQMHQDPARTQGGLGLGLLISRELVRLHGGTLHAESEGPGRGMTFVITLPVQGVPH